MKKIAVVYWSSTGNTEAMANAVKEGAAAAGADAALIEASAFDAAQTASYDAYAFGCPAMGAEELEDSEFEPMFSSVKDSLGGKPVGLFGSTAGATANGCAPGKAPARTPASHWFPKASSAAKHPMTMHLLPAKSSALLLPEFRLNTAGDGSASVPGCSLQLFEPHFSVFSKARKKFWKF